jgi:hypothetical protein
VLVAEKRTDTTKVVEPIRFCNFTGSASMGVLAALVTAVVVFID